MVKLSFSKLKLSSTKKTQEEDPTPDISRVFGGWRPKQQDNAELIESIDAELPSETSLAQSAPQSPEQATEACVGDWMRADIHRLSETMHDALDAPIDSEARAAFESAIHNLYGASGAYGGGALTRLSGSLQRLVGNTENLTEIAPLINLHVKACQAASNSSVGDESVSSAVCDALETQVENQLATKTAANW